MFCLLLFHDVTVPAHATLASNDPSKVSKIYSYPTTYAISSFIFPAIQNSSHSKQNYSLYELVIDR